jgi:hypothetical protein
MRYTFEEEEPEKPEGTEEEDFEEDEWWHFFINARAHKIDYPSACEIIKSPDLIMSSKRSVRWLLVSEKFQTTFSFSKNR